MILIINPFLVMPVASTATWVIDPGDGQATVTSSPAFNSTPWAITPGDAQATITSHPG